MNEESVDFAYYKAASIIDMECNRYCIKQYCNVDLFL
jgi:hypothetical protein